MMNNFIHFINEFWKLLIIRFSTREIGYKLIVCKSQVTPVRARSSVLHNVTRRSNEPPLSNVVVAVVVSVRTICK